MTVEDVLKYRQAVLLASAGALLHNLGKVSSRFVEMQLGILRERGEKYYFQNIAGLLLEDATGQASSISFISEAKNFGGSSDVTSLVLAQRTKKALRLPLGGLPKPFDDRLSPVYRIGDLIEYLGLNPFQLYKGRPCPIQQLFPSSLLTHLMYRCHHGASGGEKDKIYRLQQVLPLYLATPLGFERPAPDLKEYDWIKDEVEKIIQEHLSEPGKFSLLKFMKALKPLLCRIPADTQRGVNDVTVWDIGHSGMAFLKAGIWSCVGKNLTHDDLADWQGQGHPRWRLWRVGLNGLDFLAGAVSVADLRVRQQALREFFDTVRSFVEEEYPVATEVYRDENQAIYIFPDWKKDSSEYLSFQKKLEDNVSAGTNSSGKTGASLSNLYGLRPAIALSEENYHNHPECEEWKKQKQQPPNFKVSYIGDKVRRWIEEPSAAELVAEGYREVKDDLCPYCGIRSVAGGGENTERNRYEEKKARERKICLPCMRTRHRVTEEWWGRTPFSTIWIDEVADSNGRVALVVGRFGIGKILRELVYPGEVYLRKWKYKVYFPFSSRTTSSEANTQLKIKIGGKAYDCEWDGAYLVAPAGLGRYKQSEIKVTRFDKQDIPWKPQIAISKVKKTEKNTLVVSLADDTLLTIAKVTTGDDSWSAIAGKSAVVFGKTWQITGERTITFVGGSANEADSVLKNFLHELRPSESGGSPCYAELEPVSPVLDAAASSASFARFRRVWETTARFWQEIAPPKDRFENHPGEWQKELAGCTAVAVLGNGGKRRRLEIQLQKLEKPDEIVSFHAYELEVAGTSIGIVPISVQGDRAACITIENLGYIAGRFNAPQKVCADPCAAAAWVMNRLRQGVKVQIKETPGYGSGKRNLGSAVIAEVELADGEYFPVIPILAEPRVFAALVPGESAFELVRRIKERYEQEMGKVRWRLPLTLGVVFFPKHTPLRTVLDAGWRLLSVEVGEEEAEVTEDVDAPPASYLMDPRSNNKLIEHPQKKPWPRKVSFSVKVNAGRDAGERELRWCIDTTAGDGRTFDIWYPWVKVKNKPSDRALMMEHNNEAYLHVMELKAGDTIRFHPSTFDFVFLDHPGRRFEIAYREGKRLGLPRRPYYLEEVDELAELWKIVGGEEGLTSTQIHSLWQVLLARWQEWQPDKDTKAQEVWERFCEDALRNAGWPQGKLPGGDRWDKLVKAAKTGVLFDVFELFLTILKRSPRRDKKR
ncbi:hypothetical protein [Ammonifex thiophilus]|uniref:CRISPR-associated protein Csx11 n=1 Tax=Ammonifex thiophilus TaxID=444093 RepID=A0A3D8P338_9THEO|nr:hypothetical protein [Ammonifex thiophilus]RDV81262.1 hypothetical protein DXX99_09480 [Ammonifex thiophilus]